MGSDMGADSSERTIPLWLQLEETLRAHLIQREQDGGLNELLFTATRGGKNEHMIDNIRKSLDQIGARAGFDAGALRATAFRHSYATARLYTGEQALPVDGTQRDGPQFHGHDPEGLWPHDHPADPRLARPESDVTGGRGVQDYGPQRSTGGAPIGPSVTLSPLSFLPQPSDFLSLRVTLATESGLQWKTRKDSKSLPGLLLR